MNHAREGLGRGLRIGERLVEDPEPFGRLVEQAGERLTHDLVVDAGDRGPHSASISQGRGRVAHRHGGQRRPAPLAAISTARDAGGSHAPGVTQRWP